MQETSKSKKIWTDFHRSILQGKGIDIGSGNDPLSPEVQTFDVEHGDANRITEFVSDQYDFVFSSHCLEHMYDPYATILEWWQLVKPGGHLFFIVPDEDLYEQGYFPSIFNGDHKATFTIKKTKSWSPVSVNVLDLVATLPNGQLLEVALQDNNYDRSLLRHRPPYSQLSTRGKTWQKMLRKARAKLPFLARLGIGLTPEDAVIDQTLLPDRLAQIQCIVQKRPGTSA